MIAVGVSGPSPEVWWDVCGSREKIVSLKGFEVGENDAEGHHFLS